MKAHYKCPVYKVVEYRDGCVYKTKRVTEVWLDIQPRTKEEENAIAARFGGDELVSPNTSDYCFSQDCNHIVEEG